MLLLLRSLFKETENKNSVNFFSSMTKIINQLFYFQHFSLEIEFNRVKLEVIQTFKTFKSAF